MKIAILGTKGIPNNYGGYEQFAEFISKCFIERSHSVTVYNPHYHQFRGHDFNGVSIIKKYSPEKLIGGAANIIYDYLCLKDALKRDFDIIYEAGYHSVALSYKFLKVKGQTKPIIITNMDGLEWKRTKWSRPIRSIIKKFEQIAVKRSPYLVADNVGIQKYLKDKYNAESFFIPYGADPVEFFDSSHLEKYGVTKVNYLMLVARLEPENNIETIIDGHCMSSANFSLVVVGNHTTRHGKYLKDKYVDPRVRFIGGIYDKPRLDSLRHFSLAYFHGHSVGGTNPSLLEAMASQSFIIAHKNPFNESILGNSAMYFQSKGEVTTLINTIEDLRVKYSNQFVEENFTKIKTLYNWNLIATKHEELFNNLILIK
jgi:hypothetical protein